MKIEFLFAVQWFLSASITLAAKIKVLLTSIYTYIKNSQFIYADNLGTSSKK